MVTASRIKEFLWNKENVYQLVESHRIKEFLLDLGNVNWTK